MENLRCAMLMTTNILLLFFFSAAAQTGFLNINCGANSNYSDSQTTLTWTSDSRDYISVGQAANVTNTNVPDYLHSLRFFPKPLNKSCYTLPAEPKTPYLLRLWFLFGNYNGIQKLPSFNVSLETEGMLFSQMESFTVAGSPNWTTEKIFTSNNKSIYVCFIRTLDDSDPFVSAIQLSRLSSGMYALQGKPGIMLSSVSRYDLGGQSSNITRYPEDNYDRFWQPGSTDAIYNSSLVVNGSSKTTISSDNSSSNFPPYNVMQTAIVAKANVNQLRLNLRDLQKKSLVALYFGEIEAVNTSQSRIFNVMINDQLLTTVNFSMDSYIIEKQVRLNNSKTRELVISLEAIKGKGNSSRGPLINAMERYNIIDTEPVTSADDVGALSNIKNKFGFNDWISDPCFGIEWNGIKCDQGNPVRVLEIDLSGRNLSGRLPDICSLTRLEILHLQNNKLSGSIPTCLSNFSNLKELYLQNNNFSGAIPVGLLKNRRLNFRHSGNPFLGHAKNKNVGMVVGATMGTVLAVLLVLISMLIYRRRYSKKPDACLVKVTNPVRLRSFSLTELRTATQNFSQPIGQGGFGVVYFGKLQDGQGVAVKVLSASSKQGLPEFLNEIDLLSRVNHKNLMSLLGYCDVSKELMLVYEYMDGGSLREHLYGSMENPSRLDWKARLRVALDAAEGLEYLHMSATPKIIHRDVKSSNILLDFNLRAKVADFGLSRILRDDTVSHVSTTIKGTMGYMDPEYYGTNKLTEKSDVYSFGVVLLEMICGRKPIIEDELYEEEINLVKWVMLHAEANPDSPRQLADIIDKMLSLGDDDMESFKSVVDLAIRCVQREGSKRPNMSEVVAGIREAMLYMEPKYPAERPGEPFTSSDEYSRADYSSSLLHVGR
ncbi:hypothetical protein KI387_007111 [Taxus chinensis]|uniref:non-specific serine/threonine protein kinase n=1 Tax=Taxus chinensis TaxID=29808 RepID=A0AA38GRA8_TAXCH|nr:hypothetical protein KI387_007111 [Taxus chinensis]